MRGALVVAEVSLCIMLVVGAGLMMKSFVKLERVDTGFSPRDLLVARVTHFTTGTRVEKAAALSQDHERILARLRQLPGVAAAGATNALPFARAQRERSTVELKVRGRADEELEHLVALAGADVSADYFATVGIPLLRGRLFDARDTTQSPITVIVSERSARLLWPGRDPLGQEVLWGPLGGENPYATVVGVVGNVKYLSTEGDTGLELYYPYTQYPVTNVYYVMRTHGNPLGLAGTVRRIINDTNPNAAIVYIQSMPDLIGDSLWQRRLWSVMLGLFAGLAMALAAIGIYGVVSYSVTQRTRELGIRQALGARAGDVVRLVIVQGMKLTLIGVLLGVGAALALSRMLESLLFGTAGHDPLMFSLACSVVVGVSLLACYLPARRAARLDPVAALGR
jgi:predicted permease